MRSMRLKDKKILAFVDHDFDDLEHWYPVLRLQEDGATVVIAGLEAGKTYRGKSGVDVVSDVAFKDINADEFAGAIVPGGWAPDKLRRFPEVLNLIRTFDKDEKAIGQICHAGWVLASADILKGRTVTSTPGIKDDLTNAGATWVDEPVVTDGHIISSRRPPDLPQYMKVFTDYLANN